MEKPCQQCKIAFKKKASTSNKAWVKVKFCSIACKNSSNRIENTCVICGVGFLIKKAHAMNLKTCSPKCRHVHRAKLTSQRFKGTKQTEERRQLQRRLIKKAYRNGRMKHMKKVWEKQDWSNDKNPRWVPIGTKKINSYGYSKIKIAEHKWVDEHRYIMAQHIGRKIKSSEIVHHKNGDRLDNHIDNLELLTVSEHMRHHGLERGGLNPKRVDKGITLT